MKKLDVLAAALTIIGALNWGLIGAAKFDLVAAISGRQFGDTTGLTSVVYLLVGAAGVYQGLLWKRIQERWQPARATIRSR